MQSVLLILLVISLGAWSATVQPPPVIQTLSASGSNGIGPEFQVTEKQDPASEDAQFWRQVGLKQLSKTIEKAKRAKDSSYQHKAKNIIIFIGDGMGLSTISAGRIYKGQYLKHGHGEEEMLSFDEFPFTGLAKTYNVDKQVPDSAGTATAIFSGVKTDYGAIGMDSTRSTTNASQGRLDSIMDWAQREGKRTGVVTTTRITHATPAATYARIYHRDWECDTEVPQESVGIHADIARQLVENAPGNKLNVVLGGGLSPMGAFNESEVKTVQFEGGTETICKRGDNRNLATEWLQRHANDSKEAKLVYTREQLLQVDVKEVDHLMGLFRNNHITYSIAREEGEPSLQDMTEAAVGVLERGDKSKGYVLLVEGGRIDQGHHQNYARAALHEVYELDLAVQAALKMTDSDETLIIVTADHSHSVTFNGYPERGADILGAANLHKPKDPMVYETITYANGPGYFDHLANETKPANSSNVWRALKMYTKEQIESPTYRHMATLALKDETHGGEDVIVFASGPGSSLVRGVFEQNYLAYVMSYAGCMGPVKSFDESCQRHLSSAGDSKSKSSAAALRLTLLPLLAAWLIVQLL
ncbi:PREDICTED: alkaline phosphatase 4 [Drosophila arizonae]|uniref:Alkaline phosphatase n=1 Tax=Drosophila arizonae TaxID=7263 RepID=A0ABM1Q4Q2_DROAR|nr:PREDICTED: alkaline phosphatase 4 [Drosophila arizonae]XP_017874439.1 PREDICTED: alkaline phosphatase 4 [Drosophila arizonae]